MARAENPNTESTYSRAYDEAEQELRRNLPPWEAASCGQKCFISLIYLGIWVPVSILVALILGGYSLYVCLYVYPLVGDTVDEPELYYWHSEEEQYFARVRGWIFFGISTFSAFMFLVSHVQAIRTPPGEIPRLPEWEIPSEESESDDSEEERQKEKRKDGSRRTCSRCQKKKPDRTHHCKQCERCNLKMDHHCNWVANCVGYFNYKYFYLMVFYGAMLLGLFIGTFWECVAVTLNDSESTTFICFVVVLTYSLLLMLGVAVIGFLFFHTWLIWNNFTTIEYCEKKKVKNSRYNKSPFTKGAYGNFQEALGQNPWLWLLPFNYQRDNEDGLFF